MTRKFGAQTMERSTSVVHRFYVIKFLELPNVDIDEYVCVPDSWVILVLHGCPERQVKVKVAYPSGESRETTSDRVKREEAPWDEWNIYRDVVTYLTDSYDSARAWIRNNGLKLLSAPDCADTANTEALDGTSRSSPNGCSHRSPPSTSNETNLLMQEPSTKINPPLEDQNFYEKQVVNVEVASRSDDAYDLSRTADDFKLIKVEEAEYFGYVSDASTIEEDSKLIIDEVSYDNDQTCQNHHSKIPPNSEDIDGYATLTMNKLLPSVIQGEEEGMHSSMIDRPAAPPGDLNSSSLSSSLSSSSVDQNHLAQETTENRQLTIENYFDGQNEFVPLLESSKKGPFYSVHWKKQLQARVSKYMCDRRSNNTGNVRDTPLTAKNPSISTNQSHLPLPLPNGMNNRNKENVSLDIQLQKIQDLIRKNKKDEVRDKKKYSQKMKNKTRNSVANIAFKYYVVQFKDLPDPKMKIDNYVCVRKSWITSGLADIEVDNVADMNFEVKVAYPADQREIQLDFSKNPEDPRKDWKSYRAVVKHITGAYCAAGYWIEQKMGEGYAPFNNDTVKSADMGGNPPTAAAAALDNSSGSSGGFSPNLPLNDLRRFEVALARCISQPGLTVKKICKRPATSAIVDSKKRLKRGEESSAAAIFANTPSIIPFRRSASDKASLIDPREHPQHRPSAQIINETNKQIPMSAHVTNNNSTSCGLLCNGNPCEMCSNIKELINTLTIAIIKELNNKRHPLEHSYV